MRLSNVCACSFSLQQAVEKSRLFNSREGLFGKDLTEYDILGQINRAFEPFCTLWETASNWCVLLSVAFVAVVSRWFFVFVGLGLVFRVRRVGIKCQSLCSLAGPHTLPVGQWLHFRSWALQICCPFA
jgi:hypothetical protein